MLNYFSLIVASVLLLGCTIAESEQKTQRGSSRSGLANEILRSGKFTFENYHLSGVRDSATALQNMRATAAGKAAKRSSYGKSPGGYCYLQTNMLRGMLALARQGYSIKVSELAGGSHSSRSRHYQGVAYDVTYINGVKVGWNNPYYRAYMRKARALGATEVLGPGDRGHSGHLHISWPRPQ